MYVVDILVPELENKAYSEYQDNYYEEHAQRNSSGIYSRHHDAPKLKTKTQFLRLKQTEKDIFERLESVGVEMQDESFYSPNGNRVIHSVHENRSDAFDCMNDMWAKGLNAVVDHNLDLAEKAMQRIEKEHSKEKRKSNELER